LREIQAIGGGLTPAFEEQVRELARLPFDVSRGPLIRGIILKAAESINFLLLSVHHIACDGWSLEVLWQEIERAYEQSVNGASEIDFVPAPSYQEFVRWQRSFLAGNRLRTYQKYWSDELSGAKALRIPVDCERPAIRKFQGRRRFLSIGLKEVSKLDDCARREGVTRFVLMLSVLFCVLHLWTKDEDICIGTPVSNRLHSDFERIIGYLANVIVIRCKVEAGMKFHDLCAYVRSKVMDGLAFQALPFASVLRVLDYVTPVGFPPLTQVFFGYQSYPRKDVKLSGLSVVQRTLDIHVSRVDLTILAFPRNGCLDMVVESDSSIFHDSTVERLSNQFLRSLQYAAAAPDASVSEVGLVDDATTD
jgi:hypothetical protein